MSVCKLQSVARLKVNWNGRELHDYQIVEETKDDLLKTINKAVEDIATIYLHRYGDRALDALEFGVLSCQASEEGGNSELEEEFKQYNGMFSRNDLGLKGLDLGSSESLDRSDTNEDLEMGDDTEPYH